MCYINLYNEPSSTVKSSFDVNSYQSICLCSKKSAPFRIAAILIQLYFVSSCTYSFLKKFASKDVFLSVKPLFQKALFSSEHLPNFLVACKIVSFPDSYCCLFLLQSIKQSKAIQRATNPMQNSTERHNAQWLILYPAPMRMEHRVISHTPEYLQNRVIKVKPDFSSRRRHSLSNYSIFLTFLHWQ